MDKILAYGRNIAKKCFFESISSSIAIFKFKRSLWCRIAIRFSRKPKSFTFNEPIVWVYYSIDDAN